MTVQNIALIIDPTCDLPEAYIEENNVYVIPKSFEIDGKLFRDRRIALMSIEFYNNYIVKKDSKISTNPPSVDATRNFIMGSIAENYNSAMIFCISDTRSEFYSHAKSAARMVPTVISKSGIPDSFTLKSLAVVNTRSLFTGPGVITYLVVKALKDNPQLELSDLNDVVEKAKKSLVTYVIPKDLFHLKNRGRLRNEKSIGLLAHYLFSKFNVVPILQVKDGATKKYSLHIGHQSALESCFNSLKELIKDGLQENVLILSVAGEIEAFEKNREFADLKTHAQTYGVEILLSIMSIAGGVYVGPGAVSVSFCQK